MNWNTRCHYLEQLLEHIFIPNPDKSTGSLEVLKVNEKIGNYVKIGTDGKVMYQGKIINQEKIDSSTKNVSYAVLKVTPAEAVFSVDLETADIKVNGNKVEIVLQQPSVSITKFSENTQTLGEFKDVMFSLKAAEIGDNAISNAELRTGEEVKKALLNDETIMSQARSSAKKQVELIVKALRGNDCIVNVDFAN